MQWRDIQFDPPPRVLRQFAAAGLIVLGGLACWRGPGRGEWVAAGLLAAAALGVGLGGLLRPRSIRPVYVGAMLAAFPIGWATSWVALGLVYYAVFTPLAVAFRLIGRDALDRRGGSRPESYWKPKPAPTDAGRYLRQY